MGGYSFSWAVDSIFMTGVSRYFSAQFRRRSRSLTNDVYSAREQSFSCSVLISFCDRSGFCRRGFSAIPPSTAACLHLFNFSVVPRFPDFVSFVSIPRVYLRKPIALVSVYSAILLPGFPQPVSRLPFSVFAFPI